MNEPIIEGNKIIIKALVFKHSHNITTQTIAELELRNLLGGSKLGLTIYAPKEYSTYYTVFDILPLYDIAFNYRKR